MSASPLPSDLDIARLCHAIYRSAALPSDLCAPSKAPVKWDHLDESDVYWALKRLQGYDLVVFRGSVTFKDWMRDFDAWADPFDHGELGPVHPGFLKGLHEAWGRIGMVARQPVIVAGHSLGAARATILAALMTLDNKPPIRRVVFGEPRSGFVPLRAIISKVPGASYRNGNGKDHHDLVTDVPFSFPPEEYVHATPLVDVVSHESADIRADWGIFTYHHMRLYVDALAGDNAKVA